MYTIKLNNGTVLTNLTLNGNNFISDKILLDNIFTDNLDTVEISDGENIRIYNDMVLVANRVIDGKSWFILAEKTPEMKREEEMSDLQLALVELYESLLGGA